MGGTHYYTQAVLFNEAIIENEHKEEQGEDGLSETSTLDKWPILDASAEEMLAKLREVDPIMAERWHPKESRKIRRSLEIWLQTGRRASDIYEEQRRQRQASALATEPTNTNGGEAEALTTSGAGQLRWPTLIFWLHAERETLYNRLAIRVDDMVKQGLLQEAGTLSQYLHEQESCGVTVDRTRGVWISIGFKELEPYFSAMRLNTSNDRDLEEIKRQCIESVKISTRQYSRQQIKWIKSKLWNALAGAGMTQRLYLLDTSNPSAWSSSVSEPSERVVEAFLSDNETCPKPKELSDMARDMFDAKEKIGAPADDGDMIQHKTCDICGKTMQSGLQWELHLKSRRHKNTLKYAARRAGNEANPEHINNRVKSEDTPDIE